MSFKAQLKKIAQEMKLTGRTPEWVEIIYNNTRTTLYRTEDESGNNLYVGRPVGFDDSPQSRFLLTITVAGYVDGSAAINYIAQGGWGPKHKKPISFEKYKHTQRSIGKAFVSALALAYRRESVEEELKMLLQNDLGCEIVPFDWSSEEAQAERNKLSFVEATAHEVKVLQDNNLSVRIDLKKLTANWVGAKYGRVVSGQWTQESQNIAMTSALPYSVQRLLESEGMKLERVYRTKKAKKA